MPSIADNYPMLKKFLRERNTIGVDMIGPQPQHLREMQEKAFAIIDRDGTGTKAEKEAAMIAAACIIEPPSLFYNMPNLFMNYTPEVERAIERVMGTPAGMNFDPMVAMARAASGIVLMTDLTTKMAQGEKLPDTAENVLKTLKTAFGADSIVYVELQAPQLMAAFETVRDATYSTLQAEADKNRPKPKKKTNFDL